MAPIHPNKIVGLYPVPSGRHLALQERDGTAAGNAPSTQESVRCANKIIGLYRPGDSTASPRPPGPNPNPYPYSYPEAKAKANPNPRPRRAGRRVFDTLNGLKREVIRYLEVGP